MKSKKLAYNKIMVLFCIIVVLVLMTGCNGGAPPIVNIFSASPSTINQGESSTLTWSVSNADTVTITPYVGTVALSGSTSVSPVVTTNYILTATNSVGSVTASATVGVITPATDEEKVEGVVNDYFEALNELDWEKARGYCVIDSKIYYDTLQAQATLESFGDYSCEIIISITGTSVNGNYAEVYFDLASTTVVVGTNEINTFSETRENVTCYLQKVGNNWKIYDSENLNY